MREPKRRGLFLQGATALAVLGTTALCRAADHVVPLLAQVKVDKTGGKNYIVEILVTIVVIGLALWAVCKSSRRV
jgi:hypothetical protein